ncbi:hypothetical protein [Streptomyces poonensis]|uniref:ABC transporter ATP-binding protein n=1 Tax=Streptomyces poonensis TaxID=68255 RepID=A0A918UR24_9ACTN|nr:hypothetical protein GCM10010365_54700 [Streptomyces poonensis]GLJ89700.1 hypothetical protein GCM10017589_23010 [Streptomyces poonensis]
MRTAAPEHAPGRAEADGIAARARRLTKAYGSGETAALALDSVDVDIARGRFTAVMGPSGSGNPDAERGREHHPPHGSGGRVACARALASHPELIFADEPTGNLDSRAGLEVLGFLRKAVDDLGQTVVMVTHDPGAAAHSDLVLFLADGRIVDEMERPTAEAVLQRMKRFDTIRATGAVFGGGGPADGEPSS